MMNDNYNNIRVALDLGNSGEKVALGDTENQCKAYKNTVETVSEFEMAEIIAAGGYCVEYNGVKRVVGVPSYSALEIIDDDKTKYGDAFIAVIAPAIVETIKVELGKNVRSAYVTLDFVTPMKTEKTIMENYKKIQGENIHFSVNGEVFDIAISEVTVTPQAKCVARAFHEELVKDGITHFIIDDLGSITDDRGLWDNGRYVPLSGDSVKTGSKMLINKIEAELHKVGIQVSKSQIESGIAGDKVFFPDPTVLPVFLKTCEDVTREYAYAHVSDLLSKFKVNTRTCGIVSIGGTNRMIKKYINETDLKIVKDFGPFANCLAVRKLAKYGRL